MTKSSSDAGPAPQRPGRQVVKDLADRLAPTRLLVYRNHEPEPLRFHVFDPPGWRPGDTRPCFLIIHGGGWRGGETRGLYAIADYFARRGMVAISMDYRLVKGNIPPLVCVRDGRSAVRHLRAHAKELGIDPQKIVAGGGSAGAHVAVGTALFDSMDNSDDDLSVSTVPQALVLYYPVIDTSAEGYGHARCGAHWQELSPVHRVKAGMPTTIVFHGTGDTVTPFKGARRFHDEMLKVGNRCELVVHEGGVHGYFLYDLALFEEVLRKTDDFLTSLDLLEARKS